MVSWTGAPLNRVVDPEDIAFAVLYLASAAGRAYTGQILRADAGSITV
jgi:NAD(P)-dependent dehydrogenase (short-subunit alcohol dehydrogenase family)